MSAEVFLGRNLSQFSELVSKPTVMMIFIGLRGDICQNEVLQCTNRARAWPNFQILLAGPLREPSTGELAPCSEGFLDNKSLQCCGLTRLVLFSLRQGIKNGAKRNIMGREA